MTNHQTMREIVAVAKDASRLTRLKRALSKAETALLARQCDYLRELTARLPKAESVEVAS